MLRYPLQFNYHHRNISRTRLMDFIRHLFNSCMNKIDHIPMIICICKEGTTTTNTHEEKKKLFHKMQFLLLRTIALPSERLKVEK